MPLLQFFSFAARTGRRVWLVWLVVFCTFAWNAAVVLMRVEGMVLLDVYALLGLAAAKLTTETIRRVHDIGQSVWIGVVACIGIAILVAAAVLRWLGHGADLLFWSLIVVNVVAGATLFLRLGEPRHNCYGDPPGVSATSMARPSPISAATAAFWIVAGTSFGLVVLSWQEGMDRKREQRIRMPEPSPSLAPTAAPVRTGTDAENDTLSNRIDDMLTSGNAR